MRQKEIDGMVAYEVTPMGYQKSFCGKAWEIPVGDGYELVSYSTKVAKLKFKGGFEYELMRLWGGWSATTMRHVNAWLQWHHMPTITKKHWMEMEVVW